MSWNGVDIARTDGLYVGSVDRYIRDFEGTRALIIYINGLYENVVNQCAGESLATRSQLYGSWIGSSSAGKFDRRPLSSRKGGQKVLELALNFSSGKDRRGVSWWFWFKLKYRLASCQLDIEFRSNRIRNSKRRRYLDMSRTLQS